MEYVDIYDKNRIKLNKTITRDEICRTGIYHLVVHICIFNSKGELLIQRRSSNKEKWPGLWDITAGGAVTSGETSYMAMERELEEELGIKIDLSSVRPSLTINFEYGFDDVYIVQKDIDIEKLNLQSSEVDMVKWVSVDEVDEMIKSKEFMPYYDEYINLLFAMKNKLGILTE